MLGPLLFAAIWVVSLDSSMPPEARAVFASAGWIAIWWITEPVPIPVTSLLPMILFPLSGGPGMRATAGAYGQPLVFLFAGGFMLAIAIEKWQLHKRIALNIILRLGTKSTRIILGFMLATAFLSMWISNTATTMMMLPIALALLHQMQEIKNDNEDWQTGLANLSTALMLGIAYSASMGGLATLIGTPTNVIFAGVVKQLFDTEITFAQWFVLGLPLVLILLAVCWLYLTKFAFRLSNDNIAGSGSEIRSQLAALGRMGPEEKAVLAVFVTTAFAWISRSFLLKRIIPHIDDTLIALLAATALFLLPARSYPGKKLLDWESAVQLPWGILLLFGGGLALAMGFQQTGLAAWLGNQMTLAQGLGSLLILGVVVAAVNFLTEVTSNVATASMILPVLASLSTAIGVHPFVLMVGGCLAASCAFMLPVATPPNAVVFGSGRIAMKDMIKAGFALNCLSIVIITLYIYFFLPTLWGIEMDSMIGN